MKCTCLRLLAVLSVALLAAAAEAATRPRYGGTLRVQVAEQPTTFDPRSPTSAFVRRALLPLVFEGMTQTDSAGQVQPALAVSWEHDAHQRVWTFTLRSGVTFSDGSTLTANECAAALLAANPQWKVAAQGRRLLIELPEPAPYLPFTLALPRNAISKNANGQTIGTGAFAVTQWQAGHHLVVTANEDHWAGRPFLDGIEVRFGLSAHEEFVARQVAPNALLSIHTEHIKPLVQASERVLMSQPAELVVMVTVRQLSPSAETDFAIRKAMSVAIDRSGISNVILQRNGEAAGALLPQWLSGYAFLLSRPNDIEAAKKMVRESRFQSSLKLVYDVADPVLRLIAERIAVNARDAGLLIQPAYERGLSSFPFRYNSNADLLLIRVPLSSPVPAVTLEELARDMSVGPLPIRSREPEGLLGAEQQMLNSGRVIPVAFTTSAFWLGQKVRGIKVAFDGELKLQDAWVDADRMQP